MFKRDADKVEFSKLRRRWAREILRSKYFVVLTDKGSAIVMKGVDPESYTDELVVETQKAIVEEFLEQLVDVRKQHKIVLKRLVGKRNAAIKRASKTNERINRRKPSQGPK